MFLVLVHLQMSRGHSRKVKEIESWVWNFLQWTRRDICLNAAQTRLSEAQAELTGKDEMLILLFVKLADSLNPRGWNSVRQHQVTDQTRMEKSWLCEEIEMKNRAFQEDCARDCQTNSRSTENSRCGS